MPVGLELCVALKSPSLLTWLLVPLLLLLLPLLLLLVVLLGDRSDISLLLEIALLMLLLLFNTGKQFAGTLLVCAGPLDKSVIDKVVSILFTKSKLLMNLAFIIVSKCDRSARYCWSSFGHAGMSSPSSAPNSSIAISPEILFSLGNILSENLGEKSPLEKRLLENLVSKKSSTANIFSGKWFSIAL
jgi:hypothetical protein